MSLTTTFMAPPVLFALAFLLCAGLAEPLLDYRLNRALGGNHAFHWSWEHLLAPALRAAIITGFVLVAYPALFGVRVAPPLANLLDAGSARVNTLIGLLFVVSLLLPLSQVVVQRSALLVPLQGLIATAFVFAWYADYLGVTTATLWPGSLRALLLAALMVFAHRAATAVAQRLGQILDARLATQGAERLVLNSAELLAQAPVMLLYGYVLGQQIAI